MASAAPTTLQDAKTVYDYHRMHMSLRRDVDAIFCLCSLDTRVAERAARLLLDGYGQYLIFAGGAGKLTQDRFSKPEAEVFADIAVQMGVPAEKIITEPRSTNTGENVRFTWELLQQKGLHPRSFILVQKPYMERRSFATFSKQWPDPDTEFMVTSPELEWSGYPNEDNPRDLVINIAISQDIPDEVWEAGQRLISEGGFDKMESDLADRTIDNKLPHNTVMAGYDGERYWALETFRKSLQASRPLLLPDGNLAITWGGEELPPLDPDQLRYLRKLIACILDGRKITATYNIVLLIILSILALIHLYGKVGNRIKSRLIEDCHATLVFARESPEVDDEIGVSSSSSNLEVSSASEDIPKAAVIDVERQPLLGRFQTHHGIEGQRAGALNLLRSWLAYQPPPIPLIDRSLPSNGTTMFVLAIYGLNLFYQFYALPLEGRYLFAFADRAGCVFVVNLPILYLLAAKNQPLKALTGYSYEALNIFHRRVGELMCLAAAVHFAGMVAWVGWWAPDFLQPDESWSRFFTRPLVIYGVVTFAAYELLYVTSLGSFRQRCYEVFLASHVPLQIVALVFLWLHFFTASPYVCAALVIFLVDRLVYRLGLRSATVSADLSVLEDGETVLLSADWDIPRRRSSWGCFGLARKNIRYGWHPADHVFVTIPELGRGHALQAHPFTIASAAPDTNTASPDAPTHAWLNLLIRVHSGFTSDLLRHAHLNGRASVRLDGPYGSRDALDMLRGSHTAVLIAGGSGIAVVFPLVWDVARRSATTVRRKVVLYWVIHSRAQRSWIPQERLDELRRCGVHVTIPEPTAEAGRPDVPAYVAGLVSAASGTVGIVVSGPEGLNVSVRNAYAQAIRRGADARLRVEKFGW
ncbi:hypothetical protein DL770_000013 [Monosporascus sp. CRB-9-2]|nr:hypothetical protein DL770_000013 [Monosporascus sp. CRB-9-2]